MVIFPLYPFDYINHNYGGACRKMGDIMSDFEFGRRRQDAEDTAAVIAVLKENDKLLRRVAYTSHMSYSRIITLAIHHFASLSLEEQWGLVKRYVGKD